MGTVTHLRSVRRRDERTPGRLVTCEHCGERHPVIKLADGSIRCVTAFNAEEHWFCRNRGCRAAWMQKHKQ